MRSIYGHMRSRFKTALASIAIFFLLGVARMSVLCVPFRYLAGIMGKYSRNIQVSTLPDRRQVNLAWKFGTLIRKIADRTPWKSNCLAQALAAIPLLWLFGLPYALFFGLAKEKENDGLRAHAWVTVGRVAVTGGHNDEEFAVVSTFLSRPRRRFGKTEAEL